MIGIIAAMNNELEGLKPYIENARERTVSGSTFIEGTIFNKPVVCAVCGIGKVNAAVCAQTMNVVFNPNCIINTGVGGALSAALRVCDVVVASYAVQHDMDTTPLGDKPGFVSTVNVVEFPTDKALSDKLAEAMERVGVRAVRGGVASGDQFVCKMETKKYISDTFGCIACEMEGAAIAHVCYLNRKPCAILRSISDGADEGASMSFTEFADAAAKKSIEVLLEFFKNE